MLTRFQLGCSPSFRRLLPLLLILLLLVALPAFVLAQGAPVGDPSGAATGGIGSITAATTGSPTLAEVAAEAGHTKVALNFVWMLICGFLVMFMQAGFALVETGLTRAKNTAHTMAMNFLIYPVGMIGFYICGFALMMGGVGGVATLDGGQTLNHLVSIDIGGKTFGLFGGTGFFLSGATYDVTVFALFLFQMVFMDTTCTIPTGSMAERWRMPAFIAFGFFMSMFCYPIFGNWVWGGGWLATLGSNFGLGHGHVDFAGSSVVHLVGGVSALVGAKIIGPRIGKFRADGRPNAIPGHHVPMVMVGTFILAFGWFGFNAGSSLAGGDLRIAVVAVNTMLASATGALAAMFYLWKRYGKPDPTMIANGFLAGLVAITAPCAFVPSWAACLIGAIAGILCCWTVGFVENTLKIDDPVGAFAVHGMNGAWGVIALGLFADGTYGGGWNGVAGNVTGLFYGDGGQLAAQFIGTLTCIIWVGTTSYVFFKLADKLMGNRVSAEDEIAGLDLPEVGVLGYPEFQLARPSAYDQMAYGAPTGSAMHPTAVPPAAPSHQPTPVEA